MRTFKEAVLQLPEIKECFCEGLDALKKKDKVRIRANDTRLIQGSVDMDGCKGITHRPNEKRWDYIVAYDGLVFAIEVHPAGGETVVNEVIGKAKSLEKWVQSQQLIKVEKPYFLISSNNTLKGINGKKLNQLGIHSIGRILSLDYCSDLAKKFQAYKMKK